MTPGLRIRVLGSAAGGGFPQWNCACANCRGARAGAIATRPRTEDSVAVSADGRWWFLLNVSGDVRRQLDATPALHPRAVRDTPVAGVVLTNGELDHTAGLSLLRESHALVVVATERVRGGLPPLRAHATHVRLVPGEETPLAVDGRPAGLRVTAVPAPGQVPAHLRDRLPPDAEDNVGLRVRDDATGALLAYFPGVGALTDGVRAALPDADVVLFDGTFWTGDELRAAGVGTRRAEDMAHLPIAGTDGSLAALAGVRARHRFYTHLNNTNPLLREDAPERAALAAAGWAVAWDGLEIRP